MKKEEKMKNEDEKRRVEIILIQIWNRKIKIFRGKVDG